MYTEITMQPENTGNNLQPQSEAPSQSSPIPEPSSAVNQDVLSWQASEYVHHEKRGMWFIPLLIGALVLLALAIFVVQSISFSVLIIVMTIVIAVYAVRPPRIISYQLSNYGVRIDDKSFHFHDFRYFGIIQDGPLYSATLVPNKRFAPAVNIYFPADDGEKIVDLLGAYLPMEKIELDFIDKLTRQLRF